MNRFRLFINNFIIYGFGSIISKIVPFLMLPVITRLMPSPEYFGRYDMFSILLSIGQTTAVFGMYDAMYRMFFDSEDENFKVGICSSALLFTCITSVVLFVIMTVFCKELAGILLGSSKLYYLILLAAVAIVMGSVNTIVSTPTKMLNNRKVFLATNTISPVLSYGIAIPLLIKGYYDFALPFSAVLSGFSILFVFIYLNKHWFSFQKANWCYIKKMLAIAVPLYPNFILYWIFNSSDRMMIIHFIGIEAAGIYAIGSKLGQIAQLIYTAFASGWLYFSYSSMNDYDQVQMISRVFEYMGLVTFGATMFICIIAEPFFRIVFSSSYQLGGLIAPYLFMAPLLLMLSNIANSQFLIIKRVWPSTAILAISVIANLVINWFCIPMIGIEGAALGTLAAYALSVFLYVRILSRKKLLELRPVFLISTVIFFTYFVCWRFFLREDIYLNLGAVFIICDIFLFLYRKDFKQLIEQIRRMKRE